MSAICCGLIHLYRKRFPLTYAKSVVSKFFEKAEILQEFSELGQKVPKFNDTTIQKIFVYSYRLIYKLKIHIMLVIINQEY
jgi:hypothetical protein